MRHRTIENGTQAAYGYDTAGRLTAIAHTSNGTAFNTLAYTLDPTGRRTNRTENAASDQYAYDPTGQLTAAIYASGANATYAWDATGNRETVSGSVPGSGNYTANALNQYLSAQSQIPTYDTRGNLTGFAGRTHTYDSKNRLISATNGTTTAVIAYDYRNRAISRTINGVTTYFVWDDWSLIEERNASGTLTQKYIQGPGIDNLLAKTNAAGTVYYHQDGLGSTVALTDASGAVVETYTYDAFGAPVVLDISGLPIPVSGFGNRFLFTGREWITEVALYDYRNRAYDVELGRFLQTDPIRFEAGDENLYRYVGNGPGNWLDPFGLKKLCTDWLFEKDLSSTTSQERREERPGTWTRVGIPMQVNLVKGIFTRLVQRWERIIAIFGIQNITTISQYRRYCVDECDNGEWEYSTETHNKTNERFIKNRMENKDTYSTSGPLLGPGGAPPIPSP